jgi:hypothetical protein
MNRIIIIILAVLFYSLWISNMVFPDSLEGKVVNKNKTPVPGLTLYLLHTSTGRSEPRITDDNGIFYFEKVPIANSSYYLEIYWGKDIVYRNMVRIKGNVKLKDIVLN